FMAYFSSQKSSFFDSFDKPSFFFAHISMINNILFLLTRAMTFFLLLKKLKLKLFGKKKATTTT
ncbi:hypothetical protein, partial [Prevotella sp.]|uniref:hypothetical protein n=1 Tax=Prevotella sp. TaxID=59823 RepID=UPI0040283DF8